MALVPIGQGRRVEIAEPKRDMFPSTLGGAVEFTIVHFVYKVLEVMGGGIGAFAGSFLVHTMEQIEPALVDHVGPILDDILALPEIPPGIRSFLEKIRHPQSEVAAGLLMGLGSQAGGMVVSSVLGALLSPLTFALNNWLRPSRVGPGEAYAMLWRKVIGTETFRDWLADVGWPDVAIDGFGEVMRPRLALDDMIALMWRGEKDEYEVAEELEKRGYKADVIADTFKVVRRIPGPADLISMAVREAFHPDLIEKYHYMDAFPPEFAEWMTKQGVDRHWAEKYWVAHWRLPSLSNAFDMYHRLTDQPVSEYSEAVDLGGGVTKYRLLGLAGVKDLLRTADVAPTWHDLIIPLSDSPYTRVDVRRMHKAGVVSDQELVESYINIGYDVEKATRMAEWTILYNRESEIEGSKADVLRGYKLGYWLRNPAKDLLVSLGVTDDWAEYYLDIEDLHRELELIEEEIKTIRELYVNGEITRGQADARFGPLNLSAERVRRLYEEWDITRERQITRPTRGDLERWFRQDQIDETALRSELTKRGYIPDYIDKYVQDLTIRLLEEAQEAEVKARAEQEKIRVREVKTAYDVARAEKDVQIATLRVSKAENKLLLLSVEDEETAASLKEANVTIDVIIAQLVEVKAREKVEYLGMS